MNENENSKEIMPERSYSLDYKMSFNKIKKAKRNGNFLIAKVFCYDSRADCLRVDLGNGFKGVIPTDEFTVYEIKKSDSTLSPAVYSLIGKNVCACVQKIAKNGTIVLSRKANMIKSFNYISNSLDKITSCVITSIDKLGAFVDVGHGINGLIHYTNFSNSWAESIRDFGFHEGQFIDAKITSINYDKYQVELNYKVLFENLAYTLNPGDLIEAISLSKISETNNGYYAYVNPNTSAIVNLPCDLKEFPYGSKILVSVRHSSSKNCDKLRLKFISFIY